jgi:hypothetical protein
MHETRPLLAKKILWYTTYAYGITKNSPNHFGNWIGEKEIIISFQVIAKKLRGNHATYFSSCFLY